MDGEMSVDLPVRNEEAPVVEKVDRRGNPNIATANRTPNKGINLNLPDAYYNDNDAQCSRQKERPAHRLMAYMAANGFTNVEIAKATEYTPMGVSEVLKQPWMRQRIQAMQADIGDDFRQTVIQNGQAAYMRMVELSETAKSESVKNDANKYLVNRYLGMPTQPVEQVGKPVTSMSDDELKAAIGAVLGPSGPTVGGENKQ